MADTPSKEDFHVTQFIRILRSCEAHLPVSDRYEQDLPQVRGTWWTSQQEHMVAWFGNQTTRGSGAYSRAAPNTSARTTYNRLLSAPAFLWMAEALGEETAVVQAAADAARQEPDARRRPGILRKHLPWGRIAELARARDIRPPSRRSARR